LTEIDQIEPLSFSVAKNLITAYKMLHYVQDDKGKNYSNKKRR